MTILLYRNEIGMLQWHHCLRDDDVIKSHDMYNSMIMQDI